MIFRKLKKLESVISLSVVDPVMGDRGWQFGPGELARYRSTASRASATSISLADPHYTGRVSVPVLWDKKRRTIVNNESSEIIRMLNSAFDAFTDVRTDYYPAELRGEIDRINASSIATVNNGVYRAGFATTPGRLRRRRRARVFADARLSSRTAVAPALSGRRAA